MKNATKNTPPSGSLARLKNFKKGKKSLTLYLAPETHAGFKAKSRANNRTMAAQLAHFIARFLNGEMQG